MSASASPAVTVFNSPLSRIAHSCPAVHESWAEDPGPLPTDQPPFPINVGEMVIFGDTVTTFRRRATSGQFIFEADDGGAPVVRSAWRLLEEYSKGFLVRASRRGDQNVCEARARALQADAAFLAGRTTAHFQNSVDRYSAYLSAVIEEDRRRAAVGLPHLPRTGSREKGGLDVEQYPPHHLGHLIANVAVKIRDSNRPSWKTILAKLKCVEPTGHVRAAAVGDGRSLRAMPQRLHADAEKLIQQVFARELPNGAPLALIKRRVDAAIREANQARTAVDQLVAPTQKTIKSRLDQIPGIELARLQLPKGKARFAYRVTGKLPLPAVPLELVLFDYQLMKVELTVRSAGPDGVVRLKRVGRPYLGAFLDVATGITTGYFLTFRKPSKAVFLAALRTAILPKPDGATSIPAMDQGYPAYGMMHVLVTDRGPELVSEDSRAAIIDLGISIRRPAARSPWEKPHIESFFDVLDDTFSSHQPGYVGRKADKSDNLRPLEDASLLEVGDFVERLSKWMVWHAGQAPRTRTLSPFRAWAAYQKTHPGWAPDMPVSVELLDRALSLRHVRKAESDGVNIGPLYYNSDWIRTIRSDRQAHIKGNPKVNVFVRQHDLTAVWVEHPDTGECRLVPSLQPNYTCKVDWFQHENVLAASKSIKKQNQIEDEARLSSLYEAITHKSKLKFKKERSSGVSDAMAFVCLDLNGYDDSGVESEREISEDRGSQDVAFSKDPPVDRLSDGDAESEKLNVGASRAAKLAAAKRLLNGSHGQISSQGGNR